MKYTPRTYQKALVEHALAHPRCAWWASMGLGKTSAALDLLSSLLVAGAAHRVLILAPLRVCRHTWPDELRKWSDFSDVGMALLSGTSADTWGMRNVRKCPIHVLNYESLNKFEGNEALFDYDMVVADESTRLKSFRLRQGGKRAQLLARLSKDKVKRWVNLTGTPAPNGMIDLWGQMWFLDRGERLGRTFSAFAQRWFRPKFNGFGLEIMPFAEEEIRERVRDLCLAIEAKDYFDMPPIVSNTLVVDLPPAARKAYREMERKFFTEVAGKSVDAFNAASKSNKCLQLANGAIYTDKPPEWLPVHDAKIEALREVIEEAAGASVLVAYEFKSDLERILRAFPHARVLASDNTALNDWNAGKVPLLLAHPKSCGHGLNLQDGGNILCFFGLSWSLEDYQQTIERLGPTRQAQAGHDRRVFVHHIVARDTLDEEVMLRLSGKAGVQAALMEAVKRRGGAK